MSQNNVMFTGVMSALVSPVNEDGSIKEDSLRRMMQWHMDEGFTGFYLCGGTGEGTVMQVKDRKRLVEVAKEYAGDKVKLIAHVGAIDLISAVELAKHAGEIGLDAISSVPPFFYGYGEKEIAQYYTALAEASNLPVLMYASPLSGTNITCEMVDRLMNIPGMIGLKWTSYNYFEMNRIKQLNGGNINVVNGPDETLLCGLSMGADGGIGATYNVMPKVIASIYNHFQAGDMAAAKVAQEKANKLVEVLIKHGVVVGVRDILNMLGYDCGYSIYPLKRFTDEEQANFRADLKAINFEEEYI